MDTQCERMHFYWVFLLRSCHFHLHLEEASSSFKNREGFQWNTSSLQRKKLTCNELSLCKEWFPLVEMLSLLKLTTMDSERYLGIYFPANLWILAICMQGVSNGNLYYRAEQSLGLKPTLVSCLLFIGVNQRGAASTSRGRGVRSLKIITRNCIL